MQISKVGIVGCGQMGSGIGVLSSQAGYETVVSELNEDLLNKGMKNIRASLERSVARGRILKHDQDTILNRITKTTNIKDFKDSDLMIEAIVENLEAKINLFKELDDLCLPHTILASNTSCLSITEMAMATNRPEKVIGVHFFNPVAVMTLLEVVTTILTSEETYDTVKEFGESLGKSVIVARDEPGFIVNRLMTPFLLDAIRILENGVASKEDIDASMVLGCNHPMGPLRLADFIGLDTVLYIAESMYAEYKNARYNPPLTLKRMVMAGHFGRKTGKGFYEYHE
jgi:3-hydroxybutyryl-CoA dehydrogenase